MCAVHAREKRDGISCSSAMKWSKLGKMRARNITIFSGVFCKLGMLGLPLLQHKHVQALISLAVCNSALGFAGLVSSSCSNCIANVRGDQLKTNLFGNPVARRCIPTVEHFTL